MESTLKQMGRTAEAMRRGALAESECEAPRGTLSPAEAVLVEEDYSVTLMRRQLEEEARAADKYVEWEWTQVKIFLPGITPEGLQHVEMYAQALAKRIIARRNLEMNFPAVRRG